MPYRIRCAGDLVLPGELLLQDALAAGRREQADPADLAAGREDRLHSGVVARPSV